MTRITKVAVGDVLRVLKLNEETVETFHGRPVWVRVINNHVGSSFPTAEVLVGRDALRAAHWTKAADTGELELALDRDVVRRPRPADWPDEVAVEVAKRALLGGLTSGDSSN